MANTFRMTNESSVTTSAETIYTVPASTTTVLIGIMLSNKSASANIECSVLLVSTTATSTNPGASNTNDTTYIIKDVPLNLNSSLEVLSGNKIVLQAGDVLQAQSNTTTALDIAVSYMEIT
jgi:hypothetical protein